MALPGSRSVPRLPIPQLTDCSLQCNQRSARTAEKGRIGINVVSGRFRGESTAIGEPWLEHDERYRSSREFKVAYFGERVLPLVREREREAALATARKAA